MENDTEITMIFYPKESTIFASVCAILFCVVGVIGNLITVLALIRCPKLRKHATTAFVLSLCVSDLLFCSVNMPLTASRYIHQEWRFSDALCRAFPVIFYGNVAVSLLNMVAITVNRYVIISYYHLYNQIYTVPSICIQLFLIWGCSFAIMLPPLLEVWGQLGLDKSTFSCTIKEKDGHSPKKAIFLVGFVLPCIAIILCYSCIYWRVKQSRKKLQAHEDEPSVTSQSRINREKDDRRLTKLMLLIFIFFVCCFLPLMLVNVFDDDTIYPIIHVVASVLAWLSSVINPFIYAASNRQYRTAFRDFFTNIKSSMTPGHTVSYSSYSMKTCVTDVKSVQMNSTSANRNAAAVTDPQIMTLYKEPSA